MSREVVEEVPRARSTSTLARARRARRALESWEPRYRRLTCRGEGKDRTGKERTGVERTGEDKAGEERIWEERTGVRTREGLGRAIGDKGQERTGQGSAGQGLERTRQCMAGQGLYYKGCTTARRGKVET